MLLHLRFGEARPLGGCAPCCDSVRPIFAPPMHGVRLPPRQQHPRHAQAHRVRADLRRVADGCGEERAARAAYPGTRLLRQHLSRIGSFGGSVWFVPVGLRRTLFHHRGSHAGSPRATAPRGSVRLARTAPYARPLDEHRGAPVADVWDFGSARVVSAGMLQVGAGQRQQRQQRPRRVCRTQAVGGRTPNGWGLYNMLGTVWQWTWDGHTSPFSGRTDRRFGPSGSRPVRRGSGWNSHARAARAARRPDDTPGNQRNNVGVRLARTAP